MTNTSPEIVELEPQPAVAVRGEMALHELPEFFATAFVAAERAAEAQGVKIVGPPFGFYPRTPADRVVVEAGFPVSGPVECRGDAHPLMLPGGRVVRATHVGSYEAMEQTYAELQTWVRNRGLLPSGAMWESYLSGPEIDIDPATWRTQIVWPLS